MNLTPLVLEGNHVRLEPLTLNHWGPFCDVGLDPEIWQWTTSLVRTPADMRRYIETALQWQRDGKALPFAQVERSTGKVVGSTRYANVEHEHRRVEIGWTWVAPPWLRTAVNTEAKYLLLRHAFESVGCIRVEFKTDVLNVKSITALLRIGAKHEGILRKHMITANGRVRDSVYFSVLDDEWPEIKMMLEEKLARAG
jgi:RimJ/RimL family protein N-acetyltransferase